MASLFPAFLAAVLLVFAFAIFRQTETTEPTRIERAATLLGKTSLFTYVFQYVPAETVPYFLGFKGKMSVPVLCAWLLVTFAAVLLASTAWNRYVKKV